MPPVTQRIRTAISSLSSSKSSSDPPDSDQEDLQCMVKLYRRQDMGDVNRRHDYQWILQFVWSRQHKDYKEMYQARQSEDTQQYQCYKMETTNLNQEWLVYDIYPATSCTPESVAAFTENTGAEDTINSLRILAMEYKIDLPIVAAKQSREQDETKQACTIKLFRRYIGAGIAFHWALLFSFADGYEVTYEGFQNEHKRLIMEWNIGPPKIRLKFKWTKWDEYPANPCSPAEVHNAAISIRIDDIPVGDAPYKVFSSNCQKYVQLLAEKFGVELPPGAAKVIKASSPSVEAVETSLLG